MIKRFIKEIVDGLLSLVYPHYCCSCFRQLHFGEDSLCLNCAADLPLVQWQQGEVPGVAKQLKGKLPFEHTCALLYYTKQGKSGALLRSIKYGGNKELAYELGRQFGRAMLGSSVINKVDGILPVPLHPKKQAKRGFNQAEEIAKGMVRELGIVVFNKTVERTRHNKSQTRMKRDERAVNSSGLFQLKEEGTLQDKHVLILDDVITTGATIEALWKAICMEQNIKVSVATLCCPRS